MMREESSNQLLLPRAIEHAPRSLQYGPKDTQKHTKYSEENYNECPNTNK